VAYIVPSCGVDHDCLDAIFSESYQRWGGRRTLIVPGDDKGMQPCCLEPTYLFDPDIIYSYVPLSNPAVQAVHEALCGLHPVSKTPR
jgi:hypothetical protein